MTNLNSPAWPMSLAMLTLLANLLLTFLVILWLYKGRMPWRKLTITLVLILVGVSVFPWIAVEAVLVNAQLARETGAAAQLISLFAITVLCFNAHHNRLPEYAYERFKQSRSILPTRGSWERLEPELGSFRLMVAGDIGFEFVLRGLLQSYLLILFNDPLTVFMLVNTLFMMCYWRSGIIMMMAAGFIGMICSLLAWRTGSILAPMMFHVAWDVIVFWAAALQKDLFPPESPDREKETVLA